MTKLPDMLFIIDVRKEEIAVLEANRLNIPVVAVVDTNCSPDGIDQVIPGNDDALRAIRLFASRIADAILEGQNVGTEGMGLTPETSDEEVTGEQTEAVAAEESATADVQVADQSFETVETTHTDSTATGAAEEPGASGETEVRSEVETSASEDVTKVVTAETSEGKETEKESTEATAS